MTSWKRRPAPKRPSNRQRNCGEVVGNIPNPIWNRDLYNRKLLLRAYGFARYDEVFPPIKLGPREALPPGFLFRFEYRTYSTAVMITKFVGSLYIQGLPNDKWSTDPLRALRRRRIQNMNDADTRTCINMARSLEAEAARIRDDSYLQKLLKEQVAKYRADAASE